MTSIGIAISVPFTGVRSRTVAAVVATGAAVALPQLLHILGTAAGAGPAFAQSWLPMFLPVMLVGLLAGPMVGAIVGLLSPVISVLLTGMPATVLLPLMIVQLVTFGVVAGVVSSNRWLSGLKALLIVSSGQIVALVVSVLAGLFTDAAWAGTAAVWWTKLCAGLPGIAVQLFAVTLIVVWLRRRK